MNDEVFRIVDGLPIPQMSKDFGDKEVMRIIDALPIPKSTTFKTKFDVAIDDQNQRIEKLKARIKSVTESGGPPKQLFVLQQQLKKEFLKLDQILKEKLELHSKLKCPANIIHLATTEEEDNLPPIMLYAQQHDANFNQSIFEKPSIQKLTSHGHGHPVTSVMHPVASHDHPVPLHQRRAEEKFQKIQKKLLDLCSNDVRSRSTKESPNKDVQHNLDDDIKKQFDILYSELKVLEKELFHSESGAVDSSFDSMENSKRQIETLKRQNAVLLEQGEHFQVLFKEQQLEIENYRKKYMQTLQGVMEQHIRITSMESLSKFSEKKAFEEIVRMKNNLKKKLDHLTPMSNMLETCNNKLIYTIQRKSELERNYQALSDELRQLKKELAHATTGTHKAKCESLAEELKKAKELNDYHVKRINQLQNQLQQAQYELETVRNVSNKTIASTMKKSDFLRNELKSRINQLEIELAQERAKTVSN